MNKIHTFNNYMVNNKSSIRVVPNTTNGYNYELFDQSSIIPSFFSKSYDDLVDEVNYHIYDNDENNFHLEISGRQTGKTTRLVDAIIKHLKMGGTCVLYTINHRMFKHIHDMVREKVEGDTFYDPSKIIYYNGSNDCVRGLTKVKNFFDEFERIPYLEKFQSFDPKGYYCTTLKRLRNYSDLNKVSRTHWDLVLELIEYSRGNYEHRFSNIVLEMEYLIKEQFDLEYGKIFK